MRHVYGYFRLACASWLFLGGIALQYVPSAGSVEREARRRDQLLQAVPAEERSEWLRARDLGDARAEAALRLFGVLIGGIGFGISLYEAACVGAACGRRCPLDPE